VPDGLIGDSFPDSASPQVDAEDVTIVPRAGGEGISVSTGGSGTPVAGAPEGSRDEPPLAEQREPLPFDTTVAHPARVYDYWLGGKDNFASDRLAAEKVIEAYPQIRIGVRQNRAFLARVVRYLAGEAGIRQFLDLGTGLPAANNVHEVAQATAPGTRVVYVDDDPIVLVHAHALLTGTEGVVSYIDADIRDPANLLREASRTLDLNQPVAILVLMTLQLVPDSDDPKGIIRTLLDAVPSGSYLAISHPLANEERAAEQGTAVYNEHVAATLTRRSREELLRFVEGLELVDPGLVPLAEWRPEPDDPAPNVRIGACAVVGRKP
jgi:hypothetical protein